MLKGVCRDSQGEIATLGLSAENIRRLQADSPIVFEMRYEMRVLRMIIFSGATEEIMETRLHEGTGWPFVKQREMPHVTRTQAEFLVDLIEQSGGHLDIADELRQQWGISPRA